MPWELHIITACLLIMAYDKAKVMFRDIDNWVHRMLAHRAHMERLKTETPE